MTDCKNITVLGATGSIGESTLAVIALHPEKFRAYALSAHKNIDKLWQQCKQFKPAKVVVSDPQAGHTFVQWMKSSELNIEVLVGESHLQSIAADAAVDGVMAAIVGGAGLLPSLAAAKAGKTVYLANKEALVMSGQLFMNAVREHGATLLPIDSEHNAIFQSLMNQNQCHGVRKILLTGSGGPFRTLPLDQFDHVTPEQAVAHPNWSMGKKISVDSATMMNKGLELIEACWLFDCSVDDIEIVVHPQSVIHSMVAYVDGSVMAQMGHPDMRTPIAHALGYPERIDAGVAALDFYHSPQFEFHAPDPQRFPCLRLAAEAHQKGGYASIALNAANEVAVSAFLDGQLAFKSIATLIEAVMAHSPLGTPNDIEQILAHDHDSRAQAQTWLQSNAQVQ